MVAKAQGRGIEEDINVDLEPWGGIGDPILVDCEEEYVDEDRFTTVTVEAVDVSRDGLCKVAKEDEDSEDPNVSGFGNTASTTKGTSKDHNGKSGRAKERPGVARAKKKKFRYESKAERKITRHKEKLGNKTKAIARKK
jgi:ribosomal RNA-processing protein 17